MLITLKRVTWEVLCQRAPQDSLIAWLTEMDTAFSHATSFLFTLEAEALLKDTTNELSLALLDVERLNKSKSDFIAVAAHELKTPLTLIEGYTNMLRAEFPESERPQVDLMLTGISGGTRRLREIIQDMIDVSLIEMNLLKLHYQPVWLHRLVDILQFDFGEKLRQRKLSWKSSEIRSRPDQPMAIRSGCTRCSKRSSPTQ